MVTRVGRNSVVEINDSQFQQQVLRNEAVTRVMQKLGENIATEVQRKKSSWRGVTSRTFVRSGASRDNVYVVFDGDETGSDSSRTDGIAMRRSEVRDRIIRTAAQKRRRVPSV